LRQQPRPLQPTRRQAQDEQFQRSPSRRTTAFAASANANLTYLNSIAAKSDGEMLCDIGTILLDGARRIDGIYDKLDGYNAEVAA
jgi:hypothetical protein